MSKPTNKEYAEAALECLRDSSWDRSLAKQIRAYIAELETAAVSTAPTTGSAPNERDFEAYRRGVREAFDLANMIKANPQGRNAEETSAYIVRSLAELANGGKEPAASASPAASVLSEDAILAIAIDHGLGTAVVESIAKDLLAASAGGDKS